MSKNNEVIPVEAQVPSDLRKAVEAIAVKPHAGRLTLLTRKISNVLMAAAQAQGLDTQTYRIPLSKLSSQADYDSNNLVLLKEQLRKMASTTVEWHVGTKGARRWGVTSLLEVEIIEEGQRCWIEWSYPTKLKEKLLAPEIYAKLSLQMQNSFRSAAALALYEICVRYVDSPAHVTMRMHWTDWRPTLTGYPDGEEGTYQQYKYFKRDVVKPAVEEVTALTDIEVTLIEHKSGRTVADLQFEVRPKGQSGLALDEPNLFDMSLISRLMAIGFVQYQAEKIYSDTDESKLRATLDYTEKRLKQQPKLDNPQGYFRDALAKGYAVKAPGLVAGEKQKALAQPKKAKASDKPAGGDLTSKLRSAWLGEKRQEARATFDALPADEQSTLLAQFAETKMAPQQRKTWQAKGLSDPLGAAAFGDWLLRDLPTPSDLDLLQFGMAKGMLAAV